MTRKERRKQKDFMAAYEPIHENFVRFCQARSYRVMNYEDLMNETLMRAFQAWDNIQKKEALLYYLFGTARNIVLNTIRKRKEEGMDNVGEDAYSGNGSAEGDLEVQYLYEQMNKLPDVKREALILFEISGFSIKEIAQLQESTEGAVKVMLSRARKELRTLLEDEPRVENVKSRIAV